MGRALIYLAVDDNETIIYLSSRQMCGVNFDSTLINDKCDLVNELDWEETEMPQVAGCYQAVVQYEFSADEKFPFKVISCTPLIYLTVK